MNSMTYNNCAPIIIGSIDGKRWIGGLAANNYQGDSPMLVNPDNFDFRPAEGSPLIDQGRIIEGFTDGYKGRAPDIGAYEYGGEYWVPGYRNSICVFDKEITVRQKTKSIIRLALSMPPLKPVTVDASPKGKGIIITSGAVLEFNPQNWMYPQEVVIIRYSRMIAEKQLYIRFTSDRMDPVEIPVILQ